MEIHKTENVDARNDLFIYKQSFYIVTNTELFTKQTEKRKKMIFIWIF